LKACNFTLNQSWVSMAIKSLRTF